MPAKHSNERTQCRMRTQARDGAILAGSSAILSRWQPAVGQVVRLAALSVFPIIPTARLSSRARGRSLERNCHPERSEGSSQPDRNTVAAVREQRARSLASLGMTVPVEMTVPLAMI